MSPVVVALGTLVIVDRIEGPLAVLEWSEEQLTEVPVTALPDGVQEGDRLVLLVRRDQDFARGRRKGPRGAARARGRRSSALREAGEGVENAGPD